MAEYYVVLKKAVAAIDPAASDVRRTVYDKARNALIGQLKALDPPLTTAEISRQRLELEEAIRRVERESISAPAPNFDSPMPGTGRSRPQAARTTMEYRPVDEEPDLDLDLDLDAEPDEPEEPRRGSRQESRSGPREIFQRAVKETEWSAPSRRAAPPPEDEGDYEPLRGGEPERRPRRSRRELRADSTPEPTPRIDADGYEPDYDDDDDRSTPDLTAERPARMRKGRADRSGPRMPDRNADEPVRRSRLPLILTLILLAAVVAGGAAFYYKVPEVKQFALSVLSTFDRPAKSSQATGTTTPSGGGTTDKTADRVGSPPAVRAVDGSAPTPTGAGPSPAATGPGVGPGTGQAPPRPATAGGATVPVAQKATLYEESPTKEGQVVATLEGTIVWQFVQNGPDGPAIEGVVNIPDRKLRLQISIRRNTDSALPASHLVEMAVNAPADYPGGGIADIPRLVLKPVEGATGQAINGVAKKVVEGLFWIALSNDKKAIGANVALLRANAFLDIPLLYKSGQRAILTLAKGEPGTQAFEKALAAWGN